MTTSTSTGSSDRENTLSHKLVRCLAAAGVAVVAVFSATAASDLSASEAPLIINPVSTAATPFGTATALRESSLPQLVHVA